MAMPILELMTPIPDSITNDVKFHLMLETHRGYFRQEGNYEVHGVDSHAAYKYQYDLFGYLTSKNVHPELHWLVMRLSDIESPTRFDNTVQVLLLPKKEAYAKLKGLHITSLGKLGKN